MTTNEYINFMAQLRMFLRDLPKGTSADLTDYSVAYWDGHQVIGAFLSADKPGGLDEEFEVDQYFCDQISECIADWMAAPVFSFRPELLTWLTESPPFEAGMIE
jgi:hypothetical protein